MTEPTEPRPERSGPASEPDDDTRRRRDTAAEIVADGLLALLLRDRRESDDVGTRDGENGEEEHAQASGSRVRVAGRGERSAVSTTRAESPGAR